MGDDYDNRNQTSDPNTVFLFSQYNTHPVDSGEENLSLNLLEDTLEVNALGPLNRQAQRAIPDELGERAEAARDAEGGRECSPSSGGSSGGLPARRGFKRLVTGCF